MASGRLGASDVAAGTYTTVYRFQPRYICCSEH